MSFIDPYAGPFPSKSNPAQFESAADALLRYLVNDLVEAINALTVDDIAPVQAHPLDASTAKLMKVGAFGLGVTGNQSTLSDVNSLSTPTGAYRIVHGSTANTGSLPANLATGENGYMTVHRYGASAVTQIAWSRATAFNVWSRRYADGGWTPWRMTFDQRNIVGAVSRSGGAPSGAVIESGSNANGRYTRWADGTQIITKEAVTLSTLSNGRLLGDLVFPASFSDAIYTVSLPYRAPGAGANSVSYASAATPASNEIAAPFYGNKAATGCRVWIETIAGRTAFAPGDAMTFDFEATGRWY